MDPTYVPLLSAIIGALISGIFAVIIAIIERLPPKEEFPLVGPDGVPIRRSWFTALKSRLSGTPKPVRWLAVIVLVSAGGLIGYVVGSSILGGTASGWCDNFNAVHLDESRWVLIADEDDLIYVKDGVLNLGVTKQQSPLGHSLGARLEALPVGRSIAKVSFTITLESYRGNAPAGAGLEFDLEDGRDYSVKVGPGPDGPEIEFYICPAPPCSGGYDEYDHPGSGRFPVGEPVPMQVIWTGKQVEFYVDSSLRVVDDADEVPITSIQFAMYTDPGSVFHTKVDDVCVVYAEK